MALRASKYRNATSNVYRPDFQYPNLSLTTASGDGTVVAGNMWWIALAWHSNVGGAVAVLSAEQAGRRDGNPPLIQAHSGQINEMAWNPFHDWILATGGSDGLAKVWKLPQEGLTSDTNEAMVVLNGHGKRVDTLAWNPVASNIIATGGTDNTVKVWDINDASGGAKLTVSHFADNVDSLAWNYNGSLMAAVSREKKLRVFDPRTSTVSAEADSHQALGKPQRVTWLSHHKLLTTGFNKTRDREFSFWDSRSMAKPLKSTTLDASPGVLVPMFDYDTNMLFLAARGDSTIRVMEVVDDAPFYYDMPPVFDKLPQRGVCMLPKRACHVMGAEVAKLYRALNNSVIPIGFRVPRKHYMEFWEELYPETAGPDPALTAAQYLSGENKEPIKVSLRPDNPTDYGDPNAPSSGTDSPAPSDSNGGSSSPAPSASSNNGSSSSPSTSNGRSGSVSQNTGPRNFFDKPKEEVIEYYTPKEVKVVRSSKYRHIAGKSAMKIHQYENMKVLSEAAQNRAIAGNAQWIAVSWQGIAGRIGIFDVAKDKGRAPTEMGLLETGSQVLDFGFNPFKASQLATAGENAVIKIWDIPSTGVRSLKKNLTEAQAELRGHQHKVVSLDYHPTVENLLLSSSGDLTAKLWDISAEKDQLTLRGFEDLLISSAWNFAGNRLATTSKDRILRLWDVRQEQCVQSGSDIGGMLGTKVAWHGKEESKVILVGFDKNSERTIQIVDFKKMGEPLATLRIDNSSSVLTPVFDPDTGVLMLWGKGDTSIKFFEINEEGAMIHALTDHQTSTPQIGIAPLHKTNCNVRDVEIAKVYKLTQNVIDTITFTVPRTKKELFQDDIYTPTLSSEPSNDAASWFSGSDKAPKEISLQPAGMNKLSDEPKKVVEKRRVVVSDDGYMDLDKVKARMLGSLGALANIEDQPIPGDENQGVDDSEWDD